MEGGSSGSGLPRDAQGREIVGGSVGDGPRASQRLTRKMRQVVQHEHALGQEPLLLEDDRIMAQDGMNADEAVAPEDVPAVHGRRGVKMPSARVVKEHNLSHIPHAPWCDICIAARGLNRPHRSRPDPSHETRQAVNRVHVDWAFFAIERVDPSSTSL